MPTSNETLQSVLTSCEKTASSLYNRWQDEHAYENINDYGQAFIPALSAAGARYHSISARPFAVRFSIQGEHFVLKVTAKKISIAELRPSNTVKREAK